jgi:hypothetical protein
MNIDVKHRTLGIGIIGVLFILAGVALLFIVLLPPLPKGQKGQAKRISCINNLRQLGIVARTWSSEHQDSFPWNVSTKSNGVMEIATEGNVAALFRSMSNHLVTGKILSCPADAKRKREADLFTIQDKDISCFIGLDADPYKPQTILFGDRNIAGGVVASNKVMHVTSPNLVVWGKDIHAQRGNLGLGDGSAQQLSQGSLQKQMSADFQSHSLPTVRFALP